MGDPISDEDALRLQEGVAKHEQTTRDAEQAARVRTPAMGVLRPSMLPR